MELLGRIASGRVQFGRLPLEQTHGALYKMHYSTFVSLLWMASSFALGPLGTRSHEAICGWMARTPAIQRLAECCLQTSHLSDLVLDYSLVYYQCCLYWRATG